MNNFNHSESFILFELAGSTCGVRSQTVQSVEVVEHVTKVPITAPFVEGITFTRGRVISSINLRIRFGLPKVPTCPRARMLVVRPKGRTAGILVDSVREFVSIPANSIQVPGRVDYAGKSGPIDRFVEGIATLGKRVILILNLDEVFEGA
jgi:purine-binding chemotaxis protein CheW